MRCKAGLYIYSGGCIKRLLKMSALWNSFPFVLSHARITHFQRTVNASSWVCSPVKHLVCVLYHMQLIDLLTALFTFVKRFVYFTQVWKKWITWIYILRKFCYLQIIFCPSRNNAGELCSWIILYILCSQDLS